MVTELNYWLPLPKFFQDMSETLLEELEIDKTPEQVVSLFWATQHFKKHTMLVRDLATEPV